MQDEPTNKQGQTYSNRPLVFLLGPPGVGKATLGQPACEALHLTFLDFSDPATPPADLESERLALKAMITHRSADVLALSWQLQQDEDVLKLVQRSGEVLLLWAHPDEMKARSGNPAMVFTPDNPAADDGYGDRGTGCPEHRRLLQAADERALLAGMEFEEAVEEVKTWIEITIQEHCFSSDVMDGIHHWAVDWQAEQGADKKAARMIASAMGGYTLELKRWGADEADLAGVYDDLRAAGTLVFEHDAPAGEEDYVLEHFVRAPWVEEFRRKYAESDEAVEQYRRTIERFWKHMAKIRLVRR